MTNNLNTSVNIEELAREVRKLVWNLEKNLKPLLIALSPQLKKELANVLDQSLEFISTVVENTKAYREFIPVDMEVGELWMNFNVTTTLRGLNKQIIHLSRLLNDTVILCTSEALQEAMRYFNNVEKLAANNDRDAQKIYHTLKTIFERDSDSQPNNSHAIVENNRGGHNENTTDSPA